MIGFRDTVTLALTKLRAKPLRLITTLLLAGLLFGVLVAASLVMTGALRSVDSFRQDGLTNRHIVLVRESMTSGSIHHITRNPEIIAELKQRYEQIVKDKTAEAERLGLYYSQASDQPPWHEAADGKGDTLNIRDSNNITQQVLEERFSGVSSIDDQQLRIHSDEYRATDQYYAEGYRLLQGSALIPLTDGKEVFTKDYIEKNVTFSSEAAISNETSIEPSQLTKDFLLPGNAGWTPDSQALPLILPQEKIEQLLDMPAPGKDAAAGDKLQHLTTLREKAADLTVTVCYRNDASLALVQQAIDQREAGDRRDDDTTPSVTYVLPDSAKCETPQISQDTRTAQQKLQSDNQHEFNKKFGLATDPESYFVSFKIVGISPQRIYGPGQTGKMESLSDVMTNLLATDGIGQSVPRELYEKMENKALFDDVLRATSLYVFGVNDNKQRYLEFASTADAQRFIREQGCVTQMTGECLPADHPYQLYTQFSNSAAIDDIQTTAQQWFVYGALGVAGLAVIIMWIAVGRTMTDGRRETAVFRAVGFTRFDITAVYLCYTALLVILIGLLALVVGFGAAIAIDATYAADLTVQAQYGFGALDLSKEVSLTGVDYQQLGLILAGCVATGMVSVIIPLLRNVRRNPLRDMRDE